MKIVAFSGSLRTGSLNTHLLRAAQTFFPAGVNCEEASFADVPLYNEDIDGESKPTAVLRLKEQVAAADALLISTPEYNYGIPGGFKNALDWLSRPAYKSVLAHKPVALLSASKSPVGGVRAQGQLKEVLSGVLADLYVAPEFLVPSAHTVFDAEGNLTSDELRQKLARFIGDYVNWLNVLRAK